MMIRKRHILLLGVILSISIMTSAVASNGSQIGTVGARSTAMGSCFRGLADDWSAVFFNPAGLTQLGKITIGGSLGIIMPRGDYTPYAYPDANFPFSGMFTDNREATANNFFVPALSVFYKPSEKFVMGLGVYAPFGLGAEWDLVELPADWGNTTGISKEKDNFSDHQVINIQPTVAYALTDNISIGLGASYIWGKMTIDMVKFALNPAISKWSSLQTLVNMNPLIQPKLSNLTADQYRIPAEVNMDGSGSAYGFNAGLLFKLSEKFQIGLSARYCTDLKMSGTLKKTLLLSGDSGKLSTLNQISPLVFASAEDPTGEVTKMSMLALFAGQNVVQEDYDVKASLPLPITAGAGIAYKPSDRLTFTADVSWTNWATWDVISVEPQEEGYENTELNENWANTIEGGAGFELLLRKRETRQCFLRGGFYTVATPVPDKTLNPTIIDPNRRYVATLGYGMDFGKIQVNLAGELVLFSEKEVPASAYVFDETGVQDNYAGIYNFRAFVITLDTQIDLN